MPFYIELQETKCAPVQTYKKEWVSGYPVKVKRHVHRVLTQTALRGGPTEHQQY